MQEDDDDNRVVYYDLDAGSAGHRLLLASPAPVRGGGTQRPKNPAARSAGLFRQSEVLQLDDEDPDDSEPFENPFASLLRAAPPRPQPEPSVDPAIDTEPVEPTAPKTIDVQVPRTTTRSLHSEFASPPSQSRLKPKVNRAPPLRATGGSLFTSSLSVGRAKETTHRVAVEAADARPSRWQRQAPLKLTKNRQALARSAVQKKQDTRRRSISSLDIQHSTQDDVNAPKKRRLSDLLHRATMLSQQQRPGRTQDSSLSRNAVRNDSSMREDDDLIVDTERQLKAEPLAPAFTSPTKPLVGRALQHKTHPTVSKIRGELGDSVRKAIRKSNRDFTLLRAHDQSLLRNDAHGAGGGMESIQDRPFVVVCLGRLRVQDAMSVYDNCYVHSLPASMSSDSNVFKPDAQPAPRLRVVFPATVASTLQLSPETLVKVFAPFHFVPHKAAPGSAPRRQRSGAPGETTTWMLIGTTLTEVVEKTHTCLQATVINR